MRRPHSLQLCFALSLAIASAPAALRAQVIYVNQTAAGANNGSSWADAYTSLATALSVAANDSEYWVASGTYKPGAPGDRTITFPIANNRVAVYGGFLSGMTDRTNRNWTLNPTILSGDLAGDDTAGWGNRGDNAYNVVRVKSDVITPVGIVIDGFVIRGGNADQDNPDDATGSYGGGIHAYNSTSLSISNCVITDNSASGSGGLFLRRFTTSRIANCIFSGNFASFASGNNFGSGGAGMASQAGNYSATFEGCTFAGNAAAERGGALYDTHTSFSNTYLNCLIVGNSSSGDGGGFYLRSLVHVPLSRVINCTFSANSPVALFVQFNTTYVTNCIFWGNATDITKFGGATVVPAYSDIEDPFYATANSNLNVYPLFAAYSNGTWTAGSTFDPATGRTQLTDASQNWAPGALIGATVNPDVGVPLYYAVATNTANAVWVWGDATAGGNGDTYALRDFHLQTNSPCVDTGDPLLDWSGEPDYPTGRIDMGAYGNTREATSTNIPPSLIPTGFRLLIR